MSEYEFRVSKPFLTESGKAKIIERQSPTSSESNVIFELFVLPKNKISSNGVLYNWESVEKTAHQIIGLPLHDNHRTEDSIRSNPPFGHFVDVKLKDDGLYAYADIDPEEKTFIRKVKRGDIQHCSLQIFAPKVVRREKVGGDGYYDEAHIERWLEISAVVVPGFADARIKAENLIAESFKSNVVKEFEKCLENEGYEGALKWLEKQPNWVKKEIDDVYKEVML